MVGRPHLGGTPAAIDAIASEMLESVFKSDWYRFHLILFACVPLLQSSCCVVGHIWGCPQYSTSQALGLLNLLFIHQPDENSTFWKSSFKLSYFSLNRMWLYFTINTTRSEVSRSYFKLRFLCLLGLCLCLWTTGTIVT